MSLTHAGFLGIYLICSGAKKIEMSTGVIYCTKDQSHAFPTDGNTKFCGVCGSPANHQIEMQTVSFIDSLEDGTIPIPDDEFDVLESGLFTFRLDVDDNEDYLIPTSEKVFGIGLDNDKESASEIDMSLGTIFPDVAVVLLCQEIDILKKYLYDNVEIKFGYLSRIST